MAVPEWVGKGESEMVKMLKTNLCHEVEKLPASEQQTKVSILASEAINTINTLRADLKLAEDTISTQHKLMTTGEKRGVDKAKEEIAELKADLAQATSAVDDLMAGNDKLKDEVERLSNESDTWEKNSLVNIVNRAEKAEANALENGYEVCRQRTRADKAEAQNRVLLEAGAEVIASAERSKDWELGDPLYESILALEQALKAQP